jgi:hypothetical protein
VVALSLANELPRSCLTMKMDAHGSPRQILEMRFSLDREWSSVANEKRPLSCAQKKRLAIDLKRFIWGL